MKKKIGILTTYFATNFGAMLQPFAMKRVLEQYGYDVELIRYKQHKVFNTYKPFNWRKLIRKNIFSSIQYLVSLPILFRKAAVFNSYMQKYVQPVKGFSRTIPSDKDYYFFGSDQIWNPSITDGFDDIYFGKFQVKEGAKKIVYAASAEAIEYNESQSIYLRENINNFDFVSVREQKLAEDLIRVTGRKDICSVLDPTLIADISVYDEIQQINPLPGKRYVLFYKIRNCYPFAEKIYQYARSIDAEMLILSSWYEKDLVHFSRSHKFVTYIPDAGIEIFLGSIKNAEVIFTPSFHGCVFPILYRKSFYSLVLGDTWNTRVYDFLSNLGLLDRRLRINDDITAELINYDAVYQKLEHLQKMSHIFIKKSLGIEQNETI